MRRLIAACTAAAVVIVVLVGCTSSSNSAAGSSPARSWASGGGTIKIGLIADLSGAASSVSSTTTIGANAYFDHINSQGGVGGNRIEVVTADTNSTPAGALNAAQKLVQSDHVFAIIENSLLFFAAESYLLAQHVPVVGSALDSSIWGEPKNTNLFAAGGPSDSDYVPLATGQFLKNQGVTKCSSLATAGSPSGARTMEAVIKSCQDAGLQSGYINTQIPPASTDVGAIALAIKSSASDGLVVALVPTTALLLVQRLHALGVTPKSILVLGGYGSELLESPVAVLAAQGVNFISVGYPAEVHNAGTDLRRELLAKAGRSSPPSGGEQSGYLIAVAFVAGLRAAGPHPTSESFTTNMRAIKDFDGGGLLPQKVDFGNYAPASSCLTVVRLQGKAFVPVAPIPLCAPTKKQF